MTDESINYTSREYAHSTYLSTWFEAHLFKTVQRNLRVRQGEKVLEVGCNRGGMVRRMRQLGAESYGVDINEEAIADAVINNVQVMDATQLDFPTETFDKLYSLHTIEHIADFRKALREMERVLKPGGTLLLTYPVEPGPLRGLFCLYHAVAVYKNPLLARKIHINSFNPEDMKKIAPQVNLVYGKSPFSFYPQYLTVFTKSAKV
jgi:ubiquinone/menaquinone biosynthesis C-methylase UbiE